MMRATRVADDLVDCNAVGHESLKLGFSCSSRAKERREEESEESSAHLHYLFRIFTRGAGVTHKEPRGHSLELISAEQQQQ